MNLKDIGRAAKIFDKLKVLDSEIIALDKFASILADDKSSVTIDMRINTDYCISTDSNYQPSIRNHPLFEYFGMLDRSATHAKAKEKDSLQGIISDTLAFEVLAVMLRDKQKQRQDLIDQLEKF